MAGFDASGYAAAFAPPTITVGGVTYVGVLLSADAWFAITPRLATIADDTPRAVVAGLMRDLADLSFPRPWWQVWRPRVSSLLARLSWGAQMEALGSFTVAHALAQTGRAQGRTPETNGTPSDA
jgi:hypothetical protein